MTLFTRYTKQIKDTDFSSFHKLHNNLAIKCPALLVMTWEYFSVTRASPLKLGQYCPRVYVLNKLEDIYVVVVVVVVSFHQEAVIRHRKRY